MGAIDNAVCRFIVTRCKMEVVLQLLIKRFAVETNALYANCLLRTRCYRQETTLLMYLDGAKNGEE